MKRSKTVLLRCGVCRRQKRVARLEDDHPRAAVVEVNGCDKCEANNGGFEEVFYLDKNGNDLGDPTAAEEL